MLHEVYRNSNLIKTKYYILIFFTLTCGASKFVYFLRPSMPVYSNLGELFWFGECVGVRS